MRRLLYISTARRPLERTELEDILRTSRRNNAGIGVTGLLVVGGRRFLQLLEGSDDAVAGIFERIRQDERHFAVVTLSDRIVESRLTPNWAMGFQHARAPSEDAIDLSAIVADLVAGIEDASIRIEFTQFAVHHAAAA